MILTGKSKSDFEKWIIKNYNKYSHSFHKGELSIFYDLTPQMTNGLIIEFFDSVNIPIYTEPYYYKNNLYFKQYILGHSNISEQNTYLNRNSATLDAIKRANEIYNNK